MNFSYCSDARFSNACGTLPKFLVADFLGFGSAVAAFRGGRLGEGERGSQLQLYLCPAPLSVCSPSPQSKEHPLCSSSPICQDHSFRLVSF